jgi:hypothetical protein
MPLWGVGRDARWAISQPKVPHQHCHISEIGAARPQTGVSCLRNKRPLCESYWPKRSSVSRLIRDDMTQSAGQLARRSLLRRLLAAAGVSTLFYAAPYPVAAVIKISQRAVAYQDHPEGDKRCDKCIQFQPPDGCKMVDGSISPNGYCRLFALSRQSAMPANLIASAD